MAKKPESPPPERSRRPRRVADLVPAIGGQAFRRFGFTQSVVVARWAEIVGDRYARHSRPESLTMPRGKKDGGILKVAVSGALAPMLAHVEPQVIERVNRLLGYNAVARMQLRQADIDPPARRGAVPVPAELSDETRSTLRDIADPDLRASLQSLAEALSTSRGPPIVR
ncbi:DUF721 domain-containing protein [Polymorphobacter fuscus]|nr:DciA family protein [Polymorphobacter fuscus]NJC08158.1 hypothetical protein [Polymorphobacter fuscus]